MKPALEHILNSILGDDRIKVDEQEEDGFLHLSVQAPQEQMGKIIGKNGKVINAIKNVLKIKAVKENKKLDIQVAEAAS